jgi:hypothetical protein
MSQHETCPRCAPRRVWLDYASDALGRVTALCRTCGHCSTRGIGQCRPTVPRKLGALRTRHAAVARITAFLRRRPTAYTTRGEVAASLGIAPDTTSHVLRYLERAGLARRDGTGSGTRWIYADQRRTT